MAQTGYTPIQLYYSTTASATPSAANLAAGELAINTLDEKLYFKNSSGTVKLLASSSSATGTVSTLSVVSANGLSGTVANATTTPAITLATTVTGVLKGNGTAISAAVSGTDYAPATSGSSILKGNALGGFSNAVSGTDYAPATSGSSILYGNGLGGFSNVTVGSGISFAGGTLSATGSGGTVTSVGMSVPSFLSVTGSPVTGSGTLAVSYSGTALPTTSGGTGLTGFTSANNAIYSTSSSALTAGTLPVAAGGTGATSLSSVTVGTATNLAGGGAGQIPYNTASGTTAFLAAGTSGYVLQSNGTSAPSWVAAGGSPIVLLSSTLQSGTISQINKTGLDLTTYAGFKICIIGGNSNGAGVISAAPSFRVYDNAGNLITASIYGYNSTQITNSTLSGNNGHSQAMIYMPSVSMYANNQWQTYFEFEIWFAEDKYGASIYAYTGAPMNGGYQGNTGIVWGAAISQSYGLFGGFQINFNNSNFCNNSRILYYGIKRT